MSGIRLRFGDPFLFSFFIHHAVVTSSLQKEVLLKYDHRMLRHIHKVFNLLPIASLVRNKIFITHGGVLSLLIRFLHLAALTSRLSGQASIVDRILPSMKYVGA